jgi:hypothetical protein
MRVDILIRIGLPGVMALFQPFLLGVTVYSLYVQSYALYIIIGTVFCSGIESLILNSRSPRARRKAIIFSTHYTVLIYLSFSIFVIDFQSNDLLNEKIYLIALFSVLTNLLKLNKKDNYYLYSSSVAISIITILAALLKSIYGKIELKEFIDISLVATITVYAYAIIQSARGQKLLKNKHFRLYLNMYKMFIIKSWKMQLTSGISKRLDGVWLSLMTPQQLVTYKFINAFVTVFQNINTFKYSDGMMMTKRNWQNGNFNVLAINSLAAGFGVTILMWLYLKTLGISLLAGDVFSKYLLISLICVMYGISNSFVDATVANMKQKRFEILNRGAMWSVLPITLALIAMYFNFVSREYNQEIIQASLAIGVGINSTYQKIKERK